MRFSRYQQTKLDLRDEIILGQNQNREPFGTISKDELDLLKKECSEIIEINKKSNRFLFRGFGRRYMKNTLSKSTPRLNRNPTDSNITLHNLANDYFKKKFGWYGRSEGLFCTPSYNDASVYGNNIGIVFPKNGFKYIWSEYIQDLYTDIFSKFQSNNKWNMGWQSEGDKKGNIYRTLKEIPNYKSHMESASNLVYVEYINGGDESFEKVLYLDLKNPSSIKEVDEMMETFSSYKNTDLEDNTSSEVMIKCDYYYIYRGNDDWSTQLLSPHDMFFDNKKKKIDTRLN